MPALLSRLRQRFTRPVLIWAALAGLMAFGVLGSLYDLAGVPAQETMRANSQQQRAIIDPKTGAVSGLQATEQEASPFEVAEGNPAEMPPDETDGGDDVEEIPAPQPPVEEAAVEEETTPVAETGDTFARLQRDRATGGLPIVPRAQESLVGAPAPEITEKIGNELVPMSDTKGSSASSLYRRAFTRTEDQHLVSIIVTDVGFNPEVLRQALNLPSVVTVGISPYADQPARQIEALRNKGHEVWGMLPMMGTRYPQDDPGPLGLINALTIKSAMTRLHTIMANTIGSVGFVLSPDESFSKQTDLWNPIRDEIDTRGLYLLSTHQTRDIGDLTPDEKQREHIRRADMILDSTPSAAFVRSKLASVRDLAKKQTELVILITARPQSLILLDEWLKTDPLKDVATLAPLSAIYVPYTAPVEAPKEEGGHGGGGHGEEKAESGGH